MTAAGQDLALQSQSELFRIPEALDHRVLRPQPCLVAQYLGLGDVNLTPLARLSKKSWRR